MRCSTLRRKRKRCRGEPQIVDRRAETLHHPVERRDQGDSPHDPRDDLDVESFSVRLSGRYALTPQFGLEVIYSAYNFDNFDDPVADSDPNNDPDGDGLTNLQEFAFDMDPLVSRQGPIEFTVAGEVTRVGVPVIMDFAAAQNSPPFQAVFGRRKDHLAAGITYLVEFSADLSRWEVSNAIPTRVSAESGSGTIDAVSVPFPATVPLESGGDGVPKFFRVGVANE